MHVLKKAAAIGAAAVAAVALGTPASPATAVTAGGIATASIGNCGYGGAQYCTGYGQGVPVGLSTLTVAITCSASSPFVVDRTGVGCYIKGLSDGKTYLQTGPFFTAGNESVTANEGTVPFQGYLLCVGAGWSTTNGTYHGVQGYQCQ